MLIDQGVLFESNKDNKINLMTKKVPHYFKYKSNWSQTLVFNFIRVGETIGLFGTNEIESRPRIGPFYCVHQSQLCISGPI